MIDRDTAMQWAKDAGIEDRRTGYWLAKPEQIQALITRAQNEAFERAALICDSDGLYMTSLEIRKLKQEVHASKRDMVTLTDVELKTIAADYLFLTRSNNPHASLETFARVVQDAIKAKNHPIG